MDPTNQYNRYAREPDPLQEGEYLVSSAAGQKKRFTLDQDVLFGVPNGFDPPSNETWDRRYKLHQKATSFHPTISQVVMANGIRGVEATTEEVDFVHGDNTRSDPTMKEVGEYLDHQHTLLEDSYDDTLTTLAVRAASTILMTSKAPLRAVSDFNGRVAAMVLADIHQKDQEGERLKAYQSRLAKESMILRMELAKARGETNVREIGQQVSRKAQEHLFVNGIDEYEFNRFGIISKGFL